MDQTAYFKYLQAVFKKFDATATINKDFLINYFWDKLKPSICAQLDKQDRDLEKWQDIIK